MGRFGRRTDKAREFSELHRDVVELRERLTEEQLATASLQYRLHDLERRNIEIATQLSVDRRESERREIDRRDNDRHDNDRHDNDRHDNDRPLPPPLPGPAAPARSLDDIATVADSATSDTERNAWAIEELRLAVQRLNARIDQLATDLHRNLGELGYEIERAAASTRAGAAISDLVLDRELEELRHAQLRLAGEQARYEIALRHELADVADRLRTFTGRAGTEATDS